MKIHCKLKTINYHNGFTLIELLIYMGLMTIFLTVILSIFIMTLNSRLESEATSVVHQDGRFILQRFIYDINRANSIGSPIPIGSQGGELRLTIGTNSYRYYLSGDKLYLQIDSQVPVALNGSDTKLTYLNFRNIGNLRGNTVKISFTVESRIISNKGTETKNFETTAGIRK